MRRSTIKLLEAVPAPSTVGPVQRSSQESDQCDPRFWHIFQNAAIGMAVLDSKGNLLESNPALSQMLGYGPDELRTLSFVDFTHPDDVALDWGLYQELVAGKRQNYQIEKRYYRKDGQLIWARLTASASHKPSGELAFALGMAEDITERKQANAALRESEQRFRSVFEESPLGIAMIDEQCRVLRVNAVLCDLLQYSRPELIGSSLVQFTHPADAEAERSNFGKLAKREIQSFHSEKRCIRKDGSEVWVSLTASNVHDPDGKFLYGLAMVRDTTQRRVTEQRLAFQAHHDLLTGLPNRLLLKDRLQQAIAYARRQDRLVGVFYIDLDAFKTINESLGHAKGDILLQEVAKRLVGVIREADTLARNGGDEFVLVVTDLRTLDGARAVALKVLDVISRPFLLDGCEIFITASIGISVYPLHGQEPGTLHCHADAAMYEVKRIGKNTFSFFNPEIGAAARERLELEVNLRRALERGELSLHFQPQRRLATGDLVGFEALLRWRHPVLGNIPPGKFIPIAEDTGLIVPIGTWVLEEACRQCRTWQKRGHRPVRVAVNISAAQFVRPDFVGVVESALRRTGLSSECLELEMTESLVMGDFEEAARRMNLLRALGVRIAIDDFGTGYSSLSYLRRLPIDALKADRSFLRGVGTDRNALALLQALVSLAHSLGVRIVIEGIETEEQFQCVREIGSDDGQGYFLGRPQPLSANEVEALMVHTAFTDAE